MKVLVIGSGGREHAIVWKLRQGCSREEVFCAPGNGGIESDATLVPIAASEVDRLLLFAKQERVDLTVVGPEQPLVLGIVDAFEQNGLKIFGPSKAAAQLEGSKVFSKNFMQRHGIFTAQFRSFSARESREAKQYLESITPPVVVKADGLAAGKGVVVCNTTPEAIGAVDLLTSSADFSKAGNQIVIEEYLVGEEASVFVLTDGERYAVLPAAQDHKRIKDGDEGKNTGGMGAYAPAPVLTEKLRERVEREIVLPTLRGMKTEGMPYRGCLFIGLMVTRQGPFVLEYNCRFGDPETQAILPLIEGDLGAMFLSVANRAFDPSTVRVRDASSVTVVMASGGYPDAYAVGKKIEGLEQAAKMKDVIVFHAGTKKNGPALETSGGRVLGVTALGDADDLEGTIRTAYAATREIRFDGMYFRTDIGKKGLKHMSVA